LAHPYLVAASPSAGRPIGSHDLLADILPDANRFDRESRGFHPRTSTPSSLCPSAEFFDYTGRAWKGGESIMIPCAFPTLFLQEGKTVEGLGRTEPVSGCKLKRRVAHPARLERAACGFEVRRSIQLSYGCEMWGERGDSNPRPLEPQSRALPTELRSPQTRLPANQTSSARHMTKWYAQQDLNLRPSA
jgi:hypothetical protein